LSVTKREYYQDHLEWESIEFPLILTDIQSKKGLYDIPFDASIKVWRGIDFKLKAQISCVSSNKDAFNIPQDKLENSFIPKETITGTSLDRLYSIEVAGCFVTRETSSPISLDPLRLNFKVDLSIESVTRRLGVNHDTEVIFDWFLCSKLIAWFPRTTGRGVKTHFQKIRHEIDPDSQRSMIETRSSDRDFALIIIPGLKCIIAKVPDFYDPLWAGKFCIEYRIAFGVLPTKEIRKSISEFVGFVLGCHLLKIGATSLDKSQSIVSQYAMNYWGDNAMAKCSQTASPPTDINMPGQHWQRLEEVLNSLLPAYLKLEKNLQLSAALWKYWVACDLAVGTNLPIFASAIEALAGRYLQNHPELGTSHMASAEYQTLIADELTKIASKLTGKEFKDVVINKIKNAVFRGSNEKMALFFSSIKLPTGVLETKAMRARNVMAHGSIEGAEIKKLREYAKLTQVYQTLFNRVMLRILDYEDHYIDYYSKWDNRPITAPIGGTSPS
jgi:hypothetical protein